MGSELDFDDWDADPWADEGDPWETAELDARLRDRVSGVYPPRDDSYQALAELRPLIASARRRRRSIQGVMVSTATVLAVVGGMLTAEKMLPARHQATIDASYEGGSGSGGNIDGGGPAEPRDGIGPVKTLVPPGPGTASSDTATTAGPSSSTAATPTATPGQPGGEAEDGPATTPGDAGGGTLVSTGSGSLTPASPTTARPSSTTAATAGSRTTAAPTTSTTRSTTTTVGTTTTTASGRTTLTSKCGLVDVLVGRSRVDLAVVTPNPGGRYDIHDSGPTLVDVTIYWHSNECEITAQVHDGRLITSPSDD